MDPFWQEIVKITFDKLLLGCVALFVGFYLSKRLEAYKTRLAQDLFRANQKADAVMKVVDYVTRHERKFRPVAKLLDKPTKDWGEDGKNQFLDYIEEHSTFADRILALSPLFSKEVHDVLDKYIDFVDKVVKALERDDQKWKPSKTDANSAF